MQVFSKTTRQEEALVTIGGIAKYIMLFGGSRSGKTFIAVWVIVLRALSAAGSRHCILRYRFNHVKASIVMDTFPKVMSLCYPKVKYHVDKSDWYAQFPNGAQIWFGGLDDKDRTEKILGQEYATIYLNENSQISYSSVLLAMTRLAQVVTCQATDKMLTLLMLFDCNPPSQAHWSYRLFKKKIDPETKKPLPNPDDYTMFQMNPMDNKQNLPSSYLETLQNMPSRMRKRFWDGEFSDTSENALWTDEIIDRHRVEEVPEYQRIVIAVDPSGSGDTDNLDNDAIGIIVAGLGIDGNAYIIEDLTIKAGPKTWANVATTAYDRHGADVIVAEVNYGGEMVKSVIRASKPNVPFKKLNASRGKHIRAEPISSLYEQGKVRHVGYFNSLEEEMCGFTTAGYIGEESPNRVDAMVWAISELFPRIIKDKKSVKKEPAYIPNYTGAGSWLG